jgi:HAD superfamily hydrolase (TIGR01549 family)
MKTIKAVIFDFIGTLVTVEGYSYSDSEKKLYESLLNNGFNLEYTSFVYAYEKAHEKYRTIRYRELAEVTNAVWTSEALNTLGHKITPNDKNLNKAIDLFFEDYIQSLTLKPEARKILEKLGDRFALGLVSNFTYAPVIHTSIKQLKISRFFDHVLVSQDFGWRKPSPKVFRAILAKLGVIGKEAVYVGDSPLEDIRGAQDVGMTTIFIPSQFYSLVDLENTGIRPDAVIKDLNEISQVLSVF